MIEFHEETVVRGGVRRTRGARGTDELLLERAVGETRPAPSTESESLLRPQQHRNAVWRWHIRRRQRQP